MPDRRLGGDAPHFSQRREPLGGLGFFGHPRVRPPVRQLVRPVAGDFHERVVDLDDGPGVIGDEEAFLQRIYQGIAKLVAVGKIFGTCTLLFVTPCAVQESAGCHVERGQCL